MNENVSENFHHCFTWCMEESACLAASYLNNKTCILFTTINNPIPTNAVTQIKNCHGPPQPSSNSSSTMNTTSILRI